MMYNKNRLIDRILYFRKHRPANKTVFPYIAPKESVSNNQVSSSLKKGTEFEAFIVRRFDEKYFSLIEWRSDKSVDGFFPVMSKYPDLEIQYNSDFDKMNIAIECKWREGFREEKIVLIESQLQNYKHYQKVTGNPTFLALGIGNTPSFPAQVYIIPLENIQSNILHEFEIEIFRRPKPHDSFFLDCNKGSLR